MSTTSRSGRRRTTLATASFRGASGMAFKGLLRVTLLTAVLGLVLSGCGDKDPGSTGNPSPSTSGVSSPSGATSSPSASDTVAPATGKLVDTSSFSAHVPASWRVIEAAPDFSITADDRKSLDLISFTIVNNYGNDFTLDQLAHQALRLGPWARKPALGAETTLAGEPAFHLTGPVGAGAIVDVRGALHGDKSVMVEFQSHESSAKLQEMVDSVLATWQWK